MMNLSGISVNVDFKEQVTQYYSFLDLDNTLYKGKLRHVIFDFPQYLMAQNQFCVSSFNMLMELNKRYSEGSIDRESFALNVIKYYYDGLKGESSVVIDRWAQEFWRENEDRAWFSYTLELIDLLNKYTKTVLISGSPIEVIIHVCRKLGVKELYATSGIVHDNIYCGDFNLSDEMATARAKENLIKSFSRTDIFLPNKSFAFGDSESDFPLLASVDPQNAFLITDKSNLKLYGQQMGWNVLAYEDDIVDCVNQRFMKVYSNIK